MSDRLQNRGFPHSGSPHQEHGLLSLDLMGHHVDKLLSADEWIRRMGIRRRVCGGICLIGHHPCRTAGSIYGAFHLGL